jgi:hypothetical protein
MTEINRLSAVDSIQASDLFVAWVQGNGDSRKVAASVLLTFMQDNLTFPDVTGIIEYEVQRAAPSATGFDIAITDTSDNTHLILTPSAGYATGAITLPAVANVIDKQRVLVNCTQQVTAFTVNANGATAVTGEPSALGADDFFTLQYDLATSTWYRIG